MYSRSTDVIILCCWRCKKIWLLYCIVLASSCIWTHFMEIYVTVLKTDKNSNLDHKICCLFDTVVISTLECPRCLCTYSHLCTPKHVGLKMICGQVHCWQTKTCCDELYWARNSNANLETKISSTVYWKKTGWQGKSVMQMVQSVSGLVVANPKQDDTHTNRDRHDTKGTGNDGKH